MTERLYLYDTTLRDGQQTHGVQFSTPDKIRIAEVLDALGVDHIEDAARRRVPDLIRDLCAALAVRSRIRSGTGGGQK